MALNVNLINSLMYHKYTLEIFNSNCLLMIFYDHSLPFYMFIFNKCVKINQVLHDLT